MLRYRRHTSQAGYSLVIVFLMVSLMATSAAAVLLSSRTDIRMAGRHREASVAFFTAEAGVAYAKRYLSTQYSASNKWTNALNAGTTTEDYNAGGITVDGDVLPLLYGRYSFRFIDGPNEVDAAGNTDTDPLVDQDGRIIMLVTGQALDSGQTKVLAQVVLQVELQYSGGADARWQYQGQANQSSSGVASSLDTQGVDTGGPSTTIAAGGP